MRTHRTALLAIADGNPKSRVTSRRPGEGVRGSARPPSE
ncbi:hypothetical protein QFZ64_002072 [Streptomyces sp. B3I8]|nr:hypothetical protein [Streptomyces sp. B3I8]